MHDRIDVERRKFLETAGYAGLALTSSMLVPPRLGLVGDAKAQTPPSQADHTIRIAPVSLEIAPGRIIRTTGYNGTAPGPALRLEEGRPVTINVINDSGYPNLIHWHGLYIPSAQDGATEEGSPIIAPGASKLYSFTPKPGGTRWYHSHAMAMTDLTKKHLLERVRFPDRRSRQGRSRWL